MPRRARQRLTVACAIPSSPAINRGPQPVRSRASHTRSCTASLTRPGWRCGVDGRSCAHAPDAALGLAGRADSARSSTAPSTRSPVASSPLRGETYPDQDNRRPAQLAATPAATYACTASGLMTSEAVDLSQDPQLLSQPGCLATATTRSERPEARHLDAGSVAHAGRYRAEGVTRWQTAPQRAL